MRTITINISLKWWILNENSLLLFYCEIQENSVPQKHPYWLAEYISYNPKLVRYEWTSGNLQFP